ncbi:Uncharacterised protein [Shewanella putrefaciens]|nr:Uncharacterised protein [Shewanella putrefaciens]
MMTQTNNNAGSINTVQAQIDKIMDKGMTA